VPAVAVRRERLVLFIFNRFKEYVDGVFSLKLGTIILELVCKEVVFGDERCNPVIPQGLILAKAAFYVITDVQGRRLWSR